MKSTHNPFSTWMERHRLKANEAAIIMGVSRNTIAAWRRQPPSKVVLLACAAYSQGLMPIS